MDASQGLERKEGGIVMKKIEIAILAAIASLEERIASGLINE